MDALEPYDYSQLVPFTTACLPGFLADKFDVSAADSIGRAEARCRRPLERALKSTVTGYTSTSLDSSKITLQRGKAYYALLPVWLLYTRWNDRDFLYAVNGQTGKVVGEMPFSKQKFRSLFASIVGVITVLGTVLGALACR